MTTFSTSAADYPKWVTAPTEWAAVEWTGSNLAEHDALFTAHSIPAEVMQASADILLIIIDGASQTYSIGEYVVICSADGGAWRHEPARRNLDGLVPRTEHYVTP